MNKGLGGKIVIKFTEKLISTGAFYESPTAFTISGKEYKWVDGPNDNGELVDVTYQIDYIERYPSTDDTIQIVLKSPYTFNNAEGNITVAYDMTKGSLKGAGGFVDSFTISFLPEDLVQKPNIGLHAKFNVTAAVTVDYISINFESGYAEENFEISASASVNFIKIDEENP